MSQDLPTVQAVRCVVCERLHEVTSDRYLKATIKIVRRKHMGHGRPVDESRRIVLGTEDIPAVFCDNNSCLSMAMRGDE